MAKLKTPLLSLGATGSIGKSIVFSTWKGIKTAREHVSPANPNTALQQAQRSIFSVIVAFWRAYLTGTNGKTAWNTAASNSGKPQSGFNAFTSAASKIAALVAAASMVVGESAAGIAEVGFEMLNLDDGATGDEAGDFTLEAGASVNQMLNTYTAAIVAGDLVFDVSADFATDDVIYCRVVKTAGTISAAHRSGIFKYTVG